MIVGSLAEVWRSIASRQWQGQVFVTHAGEALSESAITASLTRLEALELQHGDRLIVVLESSIASVATMVAAWAMGIVVVPVRGDPHDPGILAIMHDCGARWIVAPDVDITMANEQPPLRHEQFRFRGRRVVSGSDLALIIYTSGSTGIPKGIILTHNNVLSALNSIASYLNITQSDVIICTSPLSFDYGLYQVLLAFHCNCRTVLFGRSFNPLSLISTMQSEAVTVLPVVPSIGISFARSVRALSSQLPSLRLITNTGGHLPDQTVDLLRTTLPHTGLCLMYGLSESKRALFLDPSEVGNRRGSVGKPMPGLAAALFRRVEEDGKPVFEEVEPGTVGELFVRGPSVMQGYCNGSGGGAEIVAGAYRDDNWLATGDLFERDDEGFFYFRGRLKELIKQDGFCLYPREIESTLERNPAVRQCVVIGTCDSWGNEVACLAVQREDGDCSKSALDEVKMWLAEEIGDDYRPRLIRVLEALPLSANGKPDKQALQVQLAATEGRAL